MGKIGRLGIVIIVSLIVAACDIISGIDEKKITLAERIADFKSIPKPEFKHKTDILWNKYGVPYIVAQSDNDAAFALGMVQAHLRLGQMELGKRIVSGRISESLGFYFNDIDHSLRIMDFYKAAPEILANMPQSSKDWLNNYVAGINHYKQYLPRQHDDFKLFQFDISEPWTQEDTIALGKLGGTDLHWIAFAKMLPLLKKNDPKTFIEIEKAFFDKAQIGFDFEKTNNLDQQTKAGQFIKFLNMFNKSGSNAYAIAPKKSKTGKAILAADPHLGIFLPNFWMMAGIKSPSFNIVGMMAPGTPVFAFGRTPDIAWGGTNLRALQSDFVDLTDEIDQYEITEEKTLIKTRLGTDQEYTIRNSDMGVIISDSALFSELKDKIIALKWLGHYPTDEITAMLQVAKAKNGKAFHKALEGFGLPAQNMIFADRFGNIGNVLATSLPNRPHIFPDTLYQTPFQITEAYEKIYNATTLPALINPEFGFVASANNIPIKDSNSPLISWYSTSDERIKRLQSLLSVEKLLSLEDMMKFQQDSYSISSVALRDALFHHLGKLEDHKEFLDAESVIMTLYEWDGTYTADSRGALLIEGFLDGILRPLYHETKSKHILSYLSQDSRLIQHSADLLKNMPSYKAKSIIIQGLNRARQLGATYQVWGDIHQMKLGHLLSNMPVIGDQYITKTFPASGNRETLMKTSSSRTPHPHRVNYGSNARHVSDFSDLDANYFLLLGGQDSLIGSDNYTDQVYLWRTGQYIHMPLTPKKVVEEFPFKTTFKPMEAM